MLPQPQSSALRYFVKYCSKPDHSQAVLPPTLSSFTASSSVEQPDVEQLQDHHQYQQHAAYDRLCALADELPENPGVLHSDPWETTAHSSCRSVWDGRVTAADSEKAWVQAHEAEQRRQQRRLRAREAEQREIEQREIRAWDNKFPDSKYDYDLYCDIYGESMQ